MKKALTNRRGWIVVLLVLLLAGALTGCGNIDRGEGAPSPGSPNGIGAQQEGYPVILPDGMGNQITLEKQPQRIISLAPSHTEILFALGVGDQVMGVSDYCDYPAEALTKDKVGSSWGLNMEKIVELEPDVVFFYGKMEEQVAAQMKIAGIVVAEYMPESIQEVFDTIEGMGAILGVEPETAALIGKMEAERDAILAKVAGLPAKRVFYQVWDEPLTTAGPGSYLDELIRLAGGENIAADAIGEYPQFSQEDLVTRDPEVYLLPGHEADNMGLTTEDEQRLIDSIKSRPGYEAVTAAVNNQIYLLEPNTVSRPGPRIIEALELFARAIHPEAFQ